MDNSTQKIRKHTLDTLKSSSLFTDVPLSELKSLDSDLFKRLSFEAGETLFIEGDISDSIYIIESGKVEVFTTSRYGERVAYGEFGVGSSIGELSFVLGSNRTASVAAVEPTFVVAISNNNFIKLLSVPNVGRSILKSISTIVLDTDKKLKDEVLKKESIKELYKRVSKKFKEASSDFNKLKDEHDKIVSSERKDAVLAMAVTANEELRQPLSVVSNSLELLKNYVEVNKDNIEHDKVVHRLNSMERNLEKISRILSDYDKIEEFNISEYIDGIKMVNLKRD